MHGERGRGRLACTQCMHAMQTRGPSCAHYRSPSCPPPSRGCPRPAHFSINDALPPNHRKGGHLRQLLVAAGRSAFGARAGHGGRRGWAGRWRKRRRVPPSSHRRRWWRWSWWRWCRRAVWLWDRLACRRQRCMCCWKRSSGGWRRWTRGDLEVERLEEGVASSDVVLLAQEAGVHARLDLLRPHECLLDEAIVRLVN